MSKQFKIVGNDISDGYHTFNELYEHRCLLYLALAASHNFLGWEWKRDALTPGWFLLYWKTPYGQISYHIPERLLKYVEGRCTQNQAAEWDGHTSGDVLARLEDVVSP